MSEPTRPREPSAHPERVAGIFIVVAWGAFVFATFGILAVLLDRDPVELPVSPLYGVVALGLAMAVVYLGILFTVPARSPWLGAFATAAGVFLVVTVSAGFVDLALFAAQAASPFVWVSAVLAAAPPFASWAYFARRR